MPGDTLLNLQTRPCVPRHKSWFKVVKMTDSLRGERKYRKEETEGEEVRRKNGKGERTSSKKGKDEVGKKERKEKERRRFPL